MARALRVAGWTLIGAGLLVGLYLVYALLFTNVSARAAQADLRGRWEREVGPIAATRAVPKRPGTRAVNERMRPRESRADVAAGKTLLALSFRRPGRARPLLHDEPLFALEGVGVADLQRGPGHYPGTALPGEAGNVGIAGHRTTYGAPFYNLNLLRRGDEVRLTDRSARTWVYRVIGKRVVAPGASWVLRRDPLRRGRPLVTLTTCNPRFSDAQRLVVFAELVA